jgi:hypothetical protein
MPAPSDGSDIDSFDLPDLPPLSEEILLPDLDPVPETAPAGGAR